MNRQLFAKILLLHLIFAILSPCTLAQASNTSAPTAPAAEILGEDERLPFMQNEQTPDSREPSSGGLLLKTLGSMLLIVGLIFFGAWGAKKLGFGDTRSAALPEDPDIAVISSLSLGNGRTISTLRFGNRVLVVGSTSQSFTLLAEERSEEHGQQRTSRSVAEMLAEESSSFGDRFDQAQARMENTDAGIGGIS
jgi:flagellar biogenesis protein FliO